MRDLVQVLDRVWKVVASAPRRSPRAQGEHRSQVYVFKVRPTMIGPSTVRTTLATAYGTATPRTGV